MNPHLKARIIHALRAAADAIEAGNDAPPQLSFLSDCSDDGFDTHETPTEAMERAEEATDVDGDDEYHPDVDATSWGVYVRVECAEVTVIEKDSHGNTAADRGFHELWRVEMVPAWPTVTP